MGLVAAWVQRFPACILTPPKPPPRLFSTYPSRSGASVDHFMVSRFDGESRFQAGGVKNRSAPAVSDGICSLPVAQFRVCSERLAQCFFAMPPLEQCGECVEMAAIAYAVFGAFLDAYHESLRAEFPLSVAFFPAMTEDCSLQVRTGADPLGRRRRPSGDVRAPRICPCPCRQTLPGAQARK